MPNSIATGVAYADPYFTTCYVDSELGYTAAAQGTITQATSKSTAVTLNKPAGQITLNNASLAANTTVTFTLNNTYISANDTVILTISSGGTAGAYNAWISGLTAGSCTVAFRNVTAGALGEAVVLNFALIHCV